MRVLRRMATGLAGGLVAAMIAVPLAAQSHTSKPFAGAKVNGGTVTHTIKDGRHVLTVSDDFKVPDTPDPHWQVVGSKGRVFLLDRLNVKGAALGLAGDKVNRSITLPAYVSDVAKVQIYCSWAEAVLGEAAFSTTLMTTTASQ